MSIEHRWTLRQPARLPVSINSPALGSIRGRLRNISNGGAMVQVHSMLPANAPVELVLRVRQGGRTRPHRVPAIVTRCTQAGAALMFDRIEPDVWAAVLAQITITTTDKEVGAVLSQSVPAPSRS